MPFRNRLSPCYHCVGGSPCQSAVLRRPCSWGERTRTKRRRDGHPTAGMGVSRERCAPVPVCGSTKMERFPQISSVFQGTLRAEWSCSLGFDWDKFVPQLFGLPFEFCFNPFFSLSVSGGPQALVIFDLVFDHGVKDQCDLVGGCHSGTFGAQLGFHSAQVVA